MNKVYQKHYEILKVEEVGFPVKKVAKTVTTIENEYREYRPFYIALVTNQVNKPYYKGIKLMNALEILEDMNPKSREMKVWKHFKEHKDDQNKVLIKLTTAEKQSWLYKGFKVLKEKNIAKRITGDLYMINPLFLMPVSFTEDLVDYYEELPL
jgi:hypothetical protein